MSRDAENCAFGWTQIADVLKVHPNSAKAWLRRAVDPLPVRIGHRGVYAWRSALRDWVERQDMSLQAHRELVALRQLVGGRQCPSDEIEALKTG